ncbi:hypothetical protein BHE74_00008512 [Ensete ventricosum]|nr:hypothetical protein GW17_00016295 [Ensete ventricosum]RWW83001.1 hypothetical protein BHE74_00008512 [Ensete ventricosum]
MTSIHALLKKYGAFLSFSFKIFFISAAEISAKATDAYEEARTKVANFVNAMGCKEIVFTRYATEAVNLVAYSCGISNLRAGDEMGISHMFSGSVLPIDEIMVWSHNVGAKVLVDACQIVPHMVVDVQKLDVDFLVASSQSSPIDQYVDRSLPGGTAGYQMRYALCISLGTGMEWLFDQDTIGLNLYTVPWVSIRVRVPAFTSIKLKKKWMSSFKHKRILSTSLPRL